MILEELRIHTRHHHEKIGQTLNLFNTSLTQSQYRILLEGFYGFYKPLEVHLENMVNQENLLPDYPDRKKVPLLEQDLIALGASPTALTQLEICRHLPTLQQAAHAMGCLYVMEGSTLGGQMIARFLKTAMNLDAENGCRFFTGYGEKTGLMWQAFRTTLTDFSLDYPDTQNEIITAACQTFMALDNWLVHKIPYCKAV